MISLSASLPLPHCFSFPFLVLLCCRLSTFSDLSNVYSPTARKHVLYLNAISDRGTNQLYYKQKCEYKFLRRTAKPRRDHLILCALICDWHAPLLLDPRYHAITSHCFDILFCTRILSPNHNHTFCHLCMLLSSSLNCHPPIACIILSSQVVFLPFFLFASHPLFFLLPVYCFSTLLRHGGPWFHHRCSNRWPVYFVFGPSALGIFRRIRRIVCTHPFSRL